MPVFLGGGASNINSASITDGAIVNADINAAAGILGTKISGLIGNPGSIISIDIIANTTYSLTTLANEKVLVFAKGVVDGVGGGAAATVSLKYNGVTKDTIDAGLVSSVAFNAFSLIYAEIPGAGTQNVTLTTSYGSITQPVIAIIKLKVG